MRRAEPSAAVWAALALTAATLGVLTAATRATAPLLVAPLALVLGLLAAGARTHVVDRDVPTFHYDGPLEGRIVGIDRSALDAVRLTLDRVALRDVRPERTLARVRVALHGDQRWITPEPGLTVILTGRLSPPQGPVEPGGFDFRRQAWFQGLDAVGYTRTPVLALRPAGEGRAGLAVFRLRVPISGYVQGALPRQAGTFAAAITTGERSGIDRALMEDLRVSNLAHPLAEFDFAALR